MTQNKSASKSPHLSPDQFRKYGHQLVEWIAEYMETVESMPVFPQTAPGDIAAMLPDSAPAVGEPFDDLIRDLDDIVLKGITHWQSPKWFAYFPANASPASMLGEIATAGLGVQGMLWATSPACTEIETKVLDWLVDLLALPQGWKSQASGGGVLQLSASDATHTAIVVARSQATTNNGIAIENMVAYTSAQAHSSVEKGARIAGLQHIRPIDTDDHFAMRPEKLAEAIETDLRAGRCPIFIASTVGTTGTTAIDPLEAIGSIAQKHRLWHHVDAAYAGSAMVCPEFRHHQHGLEFADSYTFNPHKWLLTHFDCSCFYVADRKPLIDTMSITPPYLKNPASDAGTVIDYRDWQLPLGRRFRALKLWFVLRSYGIEGLRQHIRHHVRLAQELSQRIDEHPLLERIAPTPFALVCLRHISGNQATDALAKAINQSQVGYVTPSQVGSQSFIRIAVGQTYTQQHHIDALWAFISAQAKAIS